MATVRAASNDEGKQVTLNRVRAEGSVRLFVRVSVDGEHETVWTGKGKRQSVAAFHRVRKACGCTETTVSPAEFEKEWR